MIIKYDVNDYLDLLISRNKNHNTVAYEMIMSNIIIIDLKKSDIRKLQALCYLGNMDASGSWYKIIKLIESNENSYDEVDINRQGLTEKLNKKYYGNGDIK